jgi:hypothetical protein
MDLATARAETFHRAAQEYGTASEWETTKELLVLDLTRQHEIPSFYAAEASWERDELQFLQAFVANISQPIDRDTDALEYVPTQIVTEYFRYIFRTEDGRPLDGILYPSARQAHGTCVLLFFEYDDPMRPRFAGEQPLVTMKAESLRRINSRKFRQP